MIFCFSGTGNSRYIAQRIAEALQETVIDLNARIKANDTTTVDTGSDVIMVTPTYAWRIPRIVSEWMEKTKWTGAKRIWFVMDCGSEIGNAAKYNRSLAEQKQLHYMGTAQIIMPENYIAMFNAPQVDEAQQITAKAEPDIQAAIKCIQKKQEFPVPRNNLYDRLMSGPMYWMRIVCQKMSDEQYSTSGEKAGMGQKLYPLYGLYLLLSVGSH